MVIQKWNKQLQQKIEDEYDLRVMDKVQTPEGVGVIRNREGENIVVDLLNEKNEQFGTSARKKCTLVY